MDLEEKLAELCHEQWCNWIKYLFSECKHQAEPPWTVTIPQHKFLYWKGLSSMRYYELREDQKEQHRAMAREFASVLEEKDEEPES